jgi:hypothetical protein
MNLRKILFAVLVSAWVAPASADCLQMDIDALTRADAAQSRCLKLNDDDYKADLAAWDKCFERFTRDLAQEACTQAHRTTAKIQNFLWQQMVTNTRDFAETRIDQVTWRQNYQRLMKLIVEEQKEGAREVQLEREARRSAYNDAVANMRINRAISIFGQLHNNATNESNNSTTSHSFVLNGRIVNCTSFGNAINCR